MPKLGRRRVAREVARLLATQPERRADLVQQLAGYVVANKMTAQADLLLQDIADELFVQQKHLSAEVEHVFDLTTETKQALTDLLQQTTGAQTVELQTTQNPSLIGGVVVRTPRHQLDASVRRKLKIIAGGIQ